MRQGFAHWEELNRKLPDCLQRTRLSGSVCAGRATVGKAGRELEGERSNCVVGSFVRRCCGAPERCSPQGTDSRVLQQWRAALIAHTPTVFSLKWLVSRR